MRILHFTLGLPPLRSGGLTKYSYDLMSQQVANGDEVFLLSPGYTNVFGFVKRRIKKKKENNGIKVYEFQNGVPIPLLDGVKSPKTTLFYSDSISLKEIEAFYEKIKPDIFHIHTLMGMSKAMVMFLKDKGVKVVFTSHDYYGLCLKTNFIDFTGQNCDTNGGEKCAVCNSQSKSTAYLRIRNLRFLLRFKKKFRFYTKMEAGFSSEKPKDFATLANKRVKEYQNLIDYYKEVYDLVDFFHFNSNIAKKVYNRFLVPKKSLVIPISSFNISDNRVIRNVSSPVRIGFIGSSALFKGLPLLRETLIGLNNEGVNNWRLNVWGNNLSGEDNECRPIKYYGKYEAEELKKVFESMDLLIVPSICKETFSLITLEALSYGVPVLVSENVGAKDIISTYDERFIFKVTSEGLYNKLYSLIKNPSLIEKFNSLIVNKNFDYLFQDHVREIEKMYVSI